MARTNRLAALILVAVAAGCSQGDSTSAPSPPPAGGTLTITIENNVANPRNLVVPVGSQVTFVNRDGRIHEMYSDPHPEHTDCPQFDSVGRLAPGQTRQTTNLVTSRVCGFHDHLNPFITTLTGSVRIQ